MNEENEEPNEAIKNATTHIKFERNLKERMQMLVDDGQYSSLNELIRDAVRHLIEPQRAFIDKKIDELVRFGVL
jgi:Arc/MetJ-type ribon-helix-helix transcriptional regulator